MAAIHTTHDRCFHKELLREMVLAWMSLPVRDHTLKMERPAAPELGGFPLRLAPGEAKRVHCVEGLDWEFSVNLNRLRDARLTTIQTLALAVLMGEPCSREFVDEVLAEYQIV